MLDSTFSVSSFQCEMQTNWQTLLQARIEITSSQYTLHLELLSNRCSQHFVQLTSDCCCLCAHQTCSYNSLFYSSIWLRLHSVPVFPETFICGCLPGCCLCKERGTKKANQLASDSFDILQSNNNTTWKNRRHFRVIFSWSDPQIMNHYSVRIAHY